MNISLLIQLCGIPLLIVLVGLGLVLTLVACYLTFVVKRVPLLVAFLPLTLMPIMAGAIASLSGIMSTIDAQLNPNPDIAFEPGFLLLINLIPVLAGVVTSIPPAMISIFARWTLTWKASGERLLPEKTVVEDEEDETMQRDADDYLRQVVRPL